MSCRRCDGTFSLQKNSGVLLFYTERFDMASKLKKIGPGTYAVTYAVPPNKYGVFAMHDSSAPSPRSEIKRVINGPIAATRRKLIARSERMKKKT